METYKRFSVVILITSVAFSTAMIAGCSAESKSPDVTANVRTSLDQAGLKDVSVSEDRDRGLVTLGGTVASDGDKARAESLAKSAAGSLVVADQVAVLPPGGESVAKDVNADLDKGIEKNLDAVFVQNHLNHDVRYDVKNGVVMLKGTVNTPAKRSKAEQVANAVPNVKQVVNEVDVKNRKATSSGN
jgi:hyperosmotically inducible protein